MLRYDASSPFSFKNVSHFRNCLNKKRWCSLIWQCSVFFYRISWYLQVYDCKWYCVIINQHHICKINFANPDLADNVIPQRVSHWLYLFCFYVKPSFICSTNLRSYTGIDSDYYKPVRPLYTKLITELLYIDNII